MYTSIVTCHRCHAGNTSIVTCHRWHGGNTSMVTCRRCPTCNTSIVTCHRWPTCNTSMSDMQHIYCYLHLCQAKTRCTGTFLPWRHEWYISALYNQQLLKQDYLCHSCSVLLAVMLWISATCLYRTELLSAQSNCIIPRKLFFQQRIQ